MEKLNKKELLNISGGATMSYSSMINAISKGINTFLGLGRSVGTAIRRIYSGSVCGV